MLSKEELLKHPNYLLTKYQLEIYRQVVKYMQEKGLSKTDLAKQMQVSNPYISQILNGNFNYTLKKLIEIGITIGKVPELKFTPINQYIAESAIPVTFNQNSSPYISVNTDALTLESKKEGYPKTALVYSTKMKVVPKVPLTAA